MARAFRVVRDRLLLKTAAAPEPRQPDLDLSSHSLNASLVHIETQKGCQMSTAICGINVHDLHRCNELAHGRPR